MMYKKMMLLFLLALLTLQSCAQDKKAENLLLKSIYEVTKADIKQALETYGLKGNVKTAEQKRYVAPEDSLIDLSGYEVSDLSEDAHYPLLSEMDNDCKLTFNEAGKLLYRIAYGEKFSSKTIGTDTLHYSAKGDLEQRRNRLVGDDFIFSTITTFVYDENEHLVRQSTNHQSIFEYTYEEAKNQVQIVHYDEDGFAYNKVYTYDKFGLIIETHDYSEDGSLRLRWVHEYDDFGHLEREFQYYPNGDSHESEKAKFDKTIKIYRRYDEYGNCTKRLIVDAAGRITVRERKFTYYL